jgi:hypothetical protein
MTELTAPDKTPIGEKGSRPTVAGGIVLWGGTVAFGGSTALLLAILSHHHQVSFAAISALLGLSFVISLIPSGVQLRAAAMVADGSAIPTMSARLLATVAVVGIAASPILGLVLRVPVLAVVLVVIQLVVALPLACRRGGLIGVHRFSALGANMVIEGGFRVVLGGIAGLTFGITGLAAALALATGAALLVLPTTPPDVKAVQRPMTSLFNASIALILLGVFVQMDVLMAPSGLTKAGATYYDLAAIPSKGVYIVLLAAGPMVFPFVRRNASSRLIVLAAGATLLLGVLVTAVLLPFRHLIGVLLGQATPSLLLLALLGGAMAMAGANSVLINAGVARGIARPWPPLAIGMAIVAVAWATRPSATTFAVSVFVAQSLSMVLSLWVTLRGRRSSVSRDSSLVTAAIPPIDSPSVRELVFAMSGYYALQEPPRSSGLAMFDRASRKWARRREVPKRHDDVISDGQAPPDASEPEPVAEPPVTHSVVAR